MTHHAYTHPQPISYEQAEEKLQALGQTHLLQHWEFLNAAQKIHLLGEIEALDPQTFYLQKRGVERRKTLEDFDIVPFQKVAPWEEGLHSERGRQALVQAKVGVAIVAGGQGTRFGSEAPKGCYPISQVKEKSLFQLSAEKVLYASHMAGVALPLAIMTSPNNHEATQVFFASHHYFGLNQSQVSFFQQGELPFIDMNGNLFLESKEAIAKGPNGNGAFFHHFVASGIWEEWRSRGIEIINFILVDNPLADPFDLELIGSHLALGNQVTIKCIERQDPYESVGVIVADNEQKVHVLEYSEIKEEQRFARDSNGKLVHACANISLFCFDMDFVKTVAEHSTAFFPYHTAFKAAAYLSEKGESIRSQEPIAHKFEQFIFDMLPHATTVSAVVYAREECFAPLKNASGNDSPKTVKAALLAKDRRQWIKVTETSPPPHLFELSQAFYYPTKEFKQQWRGVEAPSTPYIE